MSSEPEAPTSAPAAGTTAGTTADTAPVTPAAPLSPGLLCRFCGAPACVGTYIGGGPDVQTCADCVAKADALACPRRAERIRAARRNSSRRLVRRGAPRANGGAV